MRKNIVMLENGVIYVRYTYFLAFCPIISLKIHKKYNFLCVHDLFCYFPVQTLVFLSKIIIIALQNDLFLKETLIYMYQKTPTLSVPRSHIWDRTSSMLKEARNLFFSWKSATINR